MELYNYLEKNCGKILFSVIGPISLLHYYIDINTNPRFMGWEILPLHLYIIAVTTIVGFSVGYILDKQIMGEKNGIMSA